MGKKIIFTTEQKQEIIYKYLELQNSAKQIGFEYNCSPQTIIRLLQNNNINIKNNRKIQFNQYIFDEINTAEKAYWLGFILADGYHNETRGTLTIKLQYTDYNHLIKFANFIAYPIEKIKINIHKITNNKLCSITINSRYLSNALIELNIRQRKSAKEKIADIPYQYYKDYIRGIIDGDGHINHNRIDICNSIEVLSFVKDYLNDTCSTNIGKICDHDHTYRIFICKNRLRAIKHLYYNNCVCLDRKYNYILNTYY